MSGQVWMTNSDGGYMYSDELSAVLRLAVQPMIKFRQFCDVKDAAEKGLNAGQDFHWNIYSDVATQGGTLVETSTMPKTNFTITQGTLTITEYGNSVPFTSKLDNLSKHSVKEVINKVLKNDAKKAFDNAAHAQFDRTPLRLVPTDGTATDAVTLTTNGTATATNNVALGKNHIKAIVDLMKERNLPPYMGDDYMGLGQPSSFRQLKNDLEDVHKYVERGFAMILNGEIGRYEGVRFVEQTHILKGLANDNVAWSNNKSDGVYFFGEDTVAEAIAIPEEMRGAIPSDYGRSKGIAWYYLGGFGLCHTDPEQARILKWDSAA